MRRMRRRLAVALAASLAIAPVFPVLAADPPVITGEVTKVDLSAGLIAIKHGPIVSLGLTRPEAIDDFKVRDAVMLNAIQAGDKIRFTADRVDGKLTITAIRP